MNDLLTIMDVFIDNDASNDTLFYKMLEKAIDTKSNQIKRNEFLNKQFVDLDPIILSDIVKYGPVKALSSKENLREDLKRRAEKIIKKHAFKAGGISGSVALPSDYMGKKISSWGAMALLSNSTICLAQEIAYLYGLNDFWDLEDLDPKPKFVLLLGALDCVAAPSAIRLASIYIADTAKKRIPKKALSNTFYYPVIKKTAKALDIPMTKEKFANGVHYTVRIVGIVCSAGMTFFKTNQLGHKLVEILDEAAFNYTDEKIEADIEVLERINKEEQFGNNPSIDEKAEDDA